MTDPKRWSEDDGELGADELRLLRAGLRPDVPRGAKRAVWVALAAQLPSAVAAATTAAASTGAASALTGAALVKAAGIGVLLGATTVTAVTVVERHATPARPAAPARALAAASSALRTSPRARGPVAPVTSAARPAESVAVPPGASAAPVSPERARTPAASTEPTRLATPVPGATPVATFPDETARSQHDAESRKVAAARSLLRSGQPRAALLVLDEARRDFPNGELTQEREALAIEALRALGSTTEARRRAEAFLARYPASPHATLVRRALQAPPQH